MAPDEDVLVILDEPSRPRFTIRALMILVLVSGLVTWVGLQWEWDAIRELGRMAAIEWPALIGLAWSSAKIYRNPPGRQTLPIVGLVASALGLVACPVVFFAFLFPWK